MENSILTAYSKAKDKKLDVNAVLQLVCFLQEYGLAVLKLLYVYNKIEHISILWVVRAKFLHVRERLQIGKED